MRIYNLGSINFDYVYRVEQFVRPGETMMCQSVACFAGGKGFNQTVALARAGAEAVHIGTVGRDGCALVEMLEEEGVDVSAVNAVDDFPTGHAIIQVDGSGQNCIIVAPGANASLTQGAVRSALADAMPGDWLLAQNETSAIADAIRIAHEKGMLTALNPAPMTVDVAMLPLHLLDDLIVNEIEGAELLRLVGRAGANVRASMPQALHRCFPQARIVVTLGSAGAMAVAPSGEEVTVSAYSVQAVDTTAAGDTFTGYYLAAIARGATMVDALRLASGAAAISVTRPGASPSVPKLAEVEAWMTTMVFERK